MLRQTSRIFLFFALSVTSPGKVDTSPRMRRRALNTAFRRSTFNGIECGASSGAGVAPGLPGGAKDEDGALIFAFIVEKAAL